MKLLQLFTAGIRRAVAQAVRDGLAEGIRDTFGAEIPDTSNMHGEMETLLLAYTGEQEEEDISTRRKKAR